MTPERWQKVTAIFEAALQRDAGARTAYVNEACGDDGELRREVDQMLASHDQASRFIEEPAINFAAKQSGEGPGSLIGKTIAHYQVLSSLGSGGMGDVYLALDTKLGRKIALKLLPEYLAGDTRRTQLFTKEARAASALNHPNIITIHEIGELGDRCYIAMEYVDGETLRSHIHKKETSLSKLLKYLQQVAEGLTKAHANGIVHRDLKPDNIMITRDGYAKILDFGLAKLLEQPNQQTQSDSSQVATALMSPPSVAGLIMGTVGYMSPEQAQGKTAELDHRSDIFSFGCILFETVTRKKAFEGTDVLDSLHKIVHAPTPSVRGMSPDVPIDVERIVRRCLAKDPEKRYQSIKDVAIELEELQQELKSAIERDGQIQPELKSDGSFSTSTWSARETTRGSSASDTAPTVAQPSSAEYLVSEIKRHRLGVSIALGVLVLVIGSVSFFLYKFAVQNRAKSAVPFQVAKVDRLTHIGRALDAAISPDGKFVVYVLNEAGQESLWTRDVATNSNVQIVAPAEIHYRGMNFSPDGNYVYYVRLEKNNPIAVLYQVPKLGGASKKVLVDLSTPVTFSPDGKRFAFVRRSSDESFLMLANADGTGEQKLAGLRSPQAFSVGGTFGSAVPGGGPAWSPDGKVIACPARINPGVQLVEVRVADGAIRTIDSQGWGTIERAEWLRDGTGLILCAFSRSTVSTQLWYVAYPGGESQMITKDLNQYAGVSLTADSSTLVAVQVELLSNVWIAGFNQTTTNASQLTNGQMDGYCGVTWMPDGRIVYGARKIKYADLWMMGADGGNQKQLTDDDAADRFPSVSPDGRYIVFDNLARGAGIYRMDSDGGNIKQLTERGTAPHCSPDGTWVAYTQGTQDQPSVWKVSVDGGQPVRLTDKITSRPAISPDGKRIACFYKEEIAAPWKIAIFPSEGGQPVKVFDNPVALSRFVVVRWTPEGRAILYVDDKGGVSNIWSQPVDGGQPTQVTDFKSDLIFTFDLSRDGRSLAVTRGAIHGDVVMMSTLKQ